MNERKINSRFGRVDEVAFEALVTIWCTPLNGQDISYPHKILANDFVRQNLVMIDLKLHNLDVYYGFKSLSRALLYSFFPEHVTTEALSIFIVSVPLAPYLMFGLLL